MSEDRINNEKVIALIPFLFVALNLLLKGLYISSNSLAGDEPFSVYHAQMDIPVIVDLLIVGNNPPLYEILLHFWIKLFGISELSVRFPSFIFSSVTVFTIYKTGLRFFNFKIALVVGALFTFSGFHILFAHEARVYALFAMLVSISVYFFLSIVNGNNTIKIYLILILTNVIMIYSYYFGFIVIGLQLLTVLTDRNQRTLNYRNWLVYIAALTIFSLPIIGILFARFIDTANTGTWVTPPSGVTDIYNMLWQFSNAPVVTICSIIVLLAAFVKVLVKKDINNINISIKFVLLWFVVPFFVMFLISFQIPMFVGRYLIFVSLAYYLLLAISLEYIIRGIRYGVSALVIFSALYMVTLNINGDNKRHVEATVNKIIELKTDNSLVLISPPDFALNFSYYYDIGIFMDYENTSNFTKIKSALSNDEIFAVYSLKGIDYSIKDKVIFLDAKVDQNVKNGIMEKLNKTHNLIDIHKYYEIFDIYEYKIK